METCRSTRYIFNVICVLIKNSDTNVPYKLRCKISKCICVNIKLWKILYVDTDCKVNTLELHEANCNIICIPKSNSNILPIRFMSCEISLTIIISTRGMKTWRKNVKAQNRYVRSVEVKMLPQTNPVIFSVVFQRWKTARITCRYFWTTFSSSLLSGGASAPRRFGSHNKLSLASLTDIQRLITYPSRNCKPITKYREIKCYFGVCKLIYKKIETAFLGNSVSLIVFLNEYMGGNG